MERRDWILGWTSLSCAVAALALAGWAIVDAPPPGAESSNGFWPKVLGAGVLAVIAVFAHAFKNPNSGSESTPQQSAQIIQLSDHRRKA